MASHWYGPEPHKCQLNGCTIKDHFVDGKTRFGPWAVMCMTCWRDQGFKLGPGFGQKFDVLTLEKVEG